MRNFIFVIICMVIVGIPISVLSDTLWTRTFGGDGYDLGCEIHQTTDGGFIIVGTTESFGGGDYDAWLIKMDENGDEEWSQTYGSEHGEKGNSVQQTSDGGYIIVGSSLVGDYYGDNGLLLTKTDSLGNEEWCRTFDPEICRSGNGVQLTQQGGYLIGGTVDGERTWDNGSSNDMCLLRTDSHGVIRWSWIYGYADDGEWINSIQKTGDGGFIIAGGTQVYREGSHGLLIKTNGQGVVQWNRNMTACRSGKSAQQTRDRGYIYTGSTYDSDVVLVKADSTGEFIWSETIGGEGFHSGNEVHQINDGGFIIVGTTSSFGAGGNDVGLIKTDSTGEEEWSQAFGGNDRDQGISVKQTDNGGYIILGTTESFGAGGYDVWLIRIDDEVNETIESTYSTPTDYVLEEIYPNPFNSTTTIAIGLPSPSDLKLSVYNITGQEIAVLTNERYSSGYHQFTFNADDLSSGIYFIHANVPGKMNEVRKIVLVR
ncbi:MAG: T9SS type A sorting domain-containing protein [Candidatus Electryonea clarkiae]|nr:T9SS type A sorting domain-containing protein [Candidatus Electryonea clarkiae]MDP8286061.1 T9SS type A sorting domain-containing protein [Candidatus Electryonea clarkiae]